MSRLTKGSTGYNIYIYNTHIREVIIPKRREKNSDEYYRGKIRDLEKQNRALRKRLKQLEKNSHIYEDLLLEDEESPEKELEVKKVTKIYCPECSNGTLEIVMSFDDKDIFSCTECHFKKSVKR